MPAGYGRDRSRAANLRLFLIGLVCCACPRVALAQTSVDGAIRGTVIDAKSAFTPKATIIVSNASTAFIRTKATASDGSFLLTRIPPGDYTLTAALPGFASQTIADHVFVELGSTSTVSFVSESPSQTHPSP
jgi:hypothetical protein